MKPKAGEMRFARSTNMADVPEGGGPPSAELLESGTSNDIFPDISEGARTRGRTEIYQVHSILQNDSTDPLLDGNVIIAEPPDDPNVSITILTLKDPFATRLDIARRMESGMNTGSEIDGYLFENHGATSRIIQIFQRPGTAAPQIGKTFVLIHNEGKANEIRQRVTIKTSDPVIRKFTENVDGKTTDYEAQVVQCEILQALEYSFPGSPRSRMFARAADKTMIRETVYSDAGMFYSCARLTAPVLPSDNWIQVSSVYTHVVPSNRTDVVSVGQRPTARIMATLAESPRLVQVGITPHTLRIKITEQNAFQNFVELLPHPPAPGTLAAEYFSLGQRYVIYDDGTGTLVGAGGGSVSPLSGDLVFTTKGIPDIGTSIAISYGTNMAYTSRASQGALVRAPEYSDIVEGGENDQVLPSSFSLKYPSKGQIYTVTDDGNGNLIGDGTGSLDYPSRNWILRPKHMPDAGAQFVIECDLDAMVTEIFPAPVVDAAGMAIFNLAQQPAAKSLQLTFATARSVSNTSGGSLDTTTSIKNTETTFVTRYSPTGFAPPPAAVVPTELGTNWRAGSNFGRVLDI